MPIRKLHDILDINRMKNDGVEVPLNITLEGDELPFFISWEQLSDSQIKQVRNFIVAGGSNEEILNQFESLDERAYNARTGYATEKDGIVNYGHANSDKLKILLGSPNAVDAAIRESEISDLEFIAGLFATGYSIDGVGDDTFSDLCIFLMKSSLIEYTRLVHNYLLSPYPLTNSETIAINNINLLALPESIMTTTKYNTVKSTDLPVLQFIGTARASLLYECRNNGWNYRGACSQLTRFFNKINKLIDEGVTTHSQIMREINPTTAAATRVAGIINLSSLVTLILQTRVTMR